METIVGNKTETKGIYEALMRWETKATIMKLCASLPRGATLYPYMQKTFGRLKANPMSRLSSQADMVKWILESGRKIEGKRFFEVGTGHIPVAPIGFFLCGAGSVITVDLHRRIEWGLTRQALVWIAAHRDEVFTLYRGLVDEANFDERFSILYQHQNDPIVFFKDTGIEYVAPMDAARTRLPVNSIDYHFSITVLEHIQRLIIRDIFLEAKRIIKSPGAIIHFVDMSDHFQHQDLSITRINFLRYNEKEWHRIAGNEFAYCNRLRASEYKALFEGLGFTIVRNESEVDQKCLKELRAGSSLKVDTMFSSFAPEDLSTVSLRILLEYTNSH